MSSCFDTPCAGTSVWGGPVGATLGVTFALGREEISVSRDRYVWRPAAAVRWSEAVLGALLAAVAVVAAVSRPWEWLGWLLLVPSAWLLLGTRRACRLRADDLVAQGRVFRRVIRLGDVRQAGIALGGRPWLQTRDGAVTVLRMVPPLDYGSGHPAPTLVEHVRAAASDAGARLEPPLRSPEQPPTTRPTLLGI